MRGSKLNLPCLLGLSNIAFAASALPVQTVQAEPIALSYQNESDLRGIVSVFDVFKQACLAQPVTADLPEKLLPSDYQIVSTQLHSLGFEVGSEPRDLVLSKTGNEEKDRDQGEPFIELGLPTDAAPNGECRVVWGRAWDYTQGVQDVISGIAAGFDSWLSFQLKAVRVSRPAHGGGMTEFYSDDAEWAAPCFDGTWCRASVILTLHLDDGIYLAITRGDPPSAHGGG